MEEEINAKHNPKDRNNKTTPNQQLNNNNNNGNVDANDAANAKDGGGGPPHITQKAEAENSIANLNERNDDGDGDKQSERNKQNNLSKGKWL